MTTDPSHASVAAAEEPGKPAPSRAGHGPVAIGALVASVSRPLLRGREAAVARLSLDWPSVVGPALAAVTAPERLTGGSGGGTLTISASGPVALELTHLTTELLARINAHLGREAVSRLRFSHRPLGPRAGAAAARPPAAPKPPSRAARESAAEAVAGLPDGPLKEALARLGAHLLERG